MKLSGKGRQVGLDLAFHVIFQKPRLDAGEAGDESGGGPPQYRPGENPPGGLRGGAEELPGPAGGEDLAGDG